MSDERDMQRIFDHYDLAERRRLGPARDRDAWIGVSRSLFSPGERQPCHVCGKFRSIVQAHHVVPLTVQYDRGFKYPDQQFVWLCPSHHTMVHLFIQLDGRSLEPRAMEARDKTMFAASADLSEEEFKIMMDLMHLAGASPE